MILFSSSVLSQNTRNAESDKNFSIGEGATNKKSKKEQVDIEFSRSLDFCNNNTPNMDMHCATTNDSNELQRLLKLKEIHISNIAIVVDSIQMMEEERLFYEKIIQRSKINFGDNTVPKN